MEITARTNAARLFLRPSTELNAAILGIIGRALFLYPVQLHAFVFLSNHLHMLATPFDGAALASFMQHVHSNIARAVQRINGIQGTIWQRRASVISVLDEGAQLNRLRYLLSHGVKEKLVARVREWPGVSTARALMGEERLVGQWRTSSARRCRTADGRVPVIEYYPIDLAPLPAHANLSDVERHAAIAKIVDSIEAEHTHPVLGVARVLAQDPNALPERSKRTRAPDAHWTNPGLGDRFLRFRAAFADAYRDSVEAHRSHPTSACFHYDAFLPAKQFVKIVEESHPLTLLRLLV